MTFEHTKPYEDWFWKKNEIDLVNDWVTSIDFNKKILSFKNNNEIPKVVGYLEKHFALIINLKTSNLI